MLTKFGCKVVLDAGCGDGILGKFKPNGTTVYGIDIDKEKIKIAKRYEIAKEGDIQNLPYESSFFDAVVCFHVIEHVENPQQAIDEFERVLKPNGILVIETPTPWSPNAWNDPTHLRAYTKEDILLLIINRFDVIETKYTGRGIPLLGVLRLYKISSTIGDFLADRFGIRKNHVFVVCRKVFA